MPVGVTFGAAIDPLPPVRCTGLPSSRLRAREGRLTRHTGNAQVCGWSSSLRFLTLSSHFSATHPLNGATLSRNFFAIAICIYVHLEKISVRVALHTVFADDL